VINNKETLINLLKTVEEQVPIDVKADTCLFTLDKRFRKYICFFNAQFGANKDDVIIYESKVIECMSTSDIYSKDGLHNLSSMANESQFEHTRQKQLFPLFNNIVVDAGINADTGGPKYQVSHIKKGPEKDLWVAEDKDGFFSKLFCGHDLSNPIQWLQLADDDREILPRVIRDEESGDFLIQLFHYVNKEVVVSKTIDMSTCQMDMDDAQALICPCTSVYTQNNSHTRMKEFCQNF